MRLQRMLCGLRVLAEKPLPRQMPPRLDTQNSCRHKLCPATSSSSRHCLPSNLQGTAVIEALEC